MKRSCMLSPSPPVLPRARLPALLLAVLVAACSHPAPPPADSAVPVSVAKVERKAVPDLLNAVGSVEAINSVAIKSLVDGQLLESHVKDGEDGKKGQLLFK